MIDYHLQSGNLLREFGNQREVWRTEQQIVRYGTAREFTQSVNMGLHVTNIWLACQAYNDPMLTAVQTVCLRGDCDR